MAKVSGRSLDVILPSACLTTALLLAAPPSPYGRPVEPWKLVFADEFDRDDEALDATWEFQNGPSGHILSSRWRENAKLEHGLLKLFGRKEERAGQQWTAASCWTREQFQFGYFECRYRYLPATGTNNSFWIMTTGKPAQRFEIDINEGHVPNEVNMNLHNWTGQHWAKGGRWYYGAGPVGESQQDAGFSFPLAEAITTDAIRFVSDDSDTVRVMELRAFAPSDQGYPGVFPTDAEAQPPGANLCSGATATADSVHEDYTPDKALDGQLGIPSRWLSAAGAGPHWLAVEFGQPVTIGCLQFISGWQQGQTWQGIVSTFRLEYRDGDTWRPVPGASRDDITKPADDTTPDLAHSFHVYALEWTEHELIFFFDGQEIRRQEHDICRGPAPVWLSLAIMNWAGPVTDAIDGQSMDVDYVRIWQRE